MTAKPFNVEAHMRSTGAWNEDGVSRTARGRHCKNCGRVVIAGLDADRCAIPAIADPFILDAAGELAAVLTGRATYRLLWAGGRYELDARDQFHIAGSKPGARDGLGRPVEVLASHVCGRPLGSAPLSWPTTAKEASDVPPF